MSYLDDRIGMRQTVSRLFGEESWSVGRQTVLTIEHITWGPEKQRVAVITETFSDPHGDAKRRIYIPENIRDEIASAIAVNAMTDNEAFVLLAALRYAIGRQSYGVGMVTEHLTSRIPAMSPTLREQLAREIDEVERGDSSHAGALGDECDAVRWRALRDALRGETA